MTDDPLHIGAQRAARDLTEKAAIKRLRAVLRDIVKADANGDRTAFNALMLRADIALLMTEPEPKP
jgi:hypothetical protein